MTWTKTYEDVINHTFNMLTVTGLAGRRNGSREQLFYCDCSCGTKNHKASKHQLISGNLKSCGCIKKDTEDMIGKIFTRLTIIKKLKEKGYRNGALFLCQCSCGNTIKVLKGRLINGGTKSCGCLLEENQTKYLDLIGNRYNNLIVIKKLGTITDRRDIFWECLCDCGNIANITTGNLTHGSVKSCGCIAKELIRAYRISKGKDPDVPIRTERQLLRGKVRKLGLDRKVFERDKFTCQLCGESGGKLNAHHIITVAEDDTKTLDMKNMITLCKKCHFEKAHNSNYYKVNKEIQEQLINKNSSF